MAVMLNAQNARHTKLSDQQIAELDTQWNLENRTNHQPLIAATLTNPLSMTLLRAQGASNGAVTQIVVLDMRGVSAGQSLALTQYWHRSESKFAHALQAGEKAHIGRAEFHEGSQSWRAPVTLAIADPDTKTRIGSIAFEVSLTELQRRNLARSQPGA
jgi:hypothetical protein